MKTVLVIVQMLVALLLLFAILIQSKGTGFGRTMGFSQSSFSRRGLEKLVFRATFVLAGLFIIVSVFSFLAK
jgi:protein translocase SecG subunit